MQKYLAILFLALSINFLKAQSGRLSGTILDSKTGETLPGAQVLIEGSTRGASADFDGKFAINNVPAGKVTLVISYISYTTKKIPGINVLANDVTDINVQLDPSTSQDLTEVEVVVTLNKENNTALVLQQKNNASVSDGISAETIKRTPDRNTSDVLKRVPGASIQDNKFAIVRGLNDRYNAAFLNGAPLPSTESDRKAFSFDLFPSNMLDNLVITKTARPDLPGEFAGGIIEINTKSIPEKNFLQVMAGTGYNTITTGKNQLYYKGGKRDWMGLDDGTRALPGEVPEYGKFPNDVFEQSELTKKVPVSDWGVYNKKFAPNSSYQISGGWNFKRKEKDFFGILGSVTYNSTNTYFETIRRGYQGNPTDEKDPLTLERDLLDKTFQNQKLAGALLNLSCKLNENNSISFKNLYSISSDDRVIQRSGSNNVLEDNKVLLRSTALWFTQNTALTSQLIGDHYIPKAKLKIQWNGNYAKVLREIPALRRHNYSRKSFVAESDADTVWAADLTSSNSSANEYSGVMLWSNLSEIIYNAKTDVTHNYKINKDFALESKTGAYYQMRNRIFDYRQFIYAKSGLFNNDISYLSENEIFKPKNMGYFSQSSGGFVMLENTLPESGYSAGSNLGAGYLMFDLKYKTLLRLITGARLESYTQKLSYKDTRFLINDLIITQDTTVVDLLPSVNMVVSPTSKINLRGSYSRTINRPEFRELAPFLFYDFNTQLSLNGNPQLKRALIDNYDLRFEWFPGAGQLISASGFYKKFKDPIELSKSLNATAITYTNVPSAFCQGIEMEYRINIGKFHKNDSSFFGKIWDNLTVYSNLSLIQSRIDKTNTNATYDRPMQGQSPYLLNGGISYVDNKKDFSFSTMVNRVGQRIYIVGNGDFFEVWEMPRTVWDMQVTKSFIKKRLELRLNVKDILASSQPLKYQFNYDAKPLTKNSKNTALFWQQSFGTTFSFQVSYKF